MLTLNVRGPSYLGLTRSISWLLMPWLLTSPGHQQPWYWLCIIGRFVSYLRKDFNYLRRINVEKWHKYKYMFLFPLKNLARKGLRSTMNCYEGQGIARRPLTCRRSSRAGGVKSIILNQHFVTQGKCQERKFGRKTASKETSQYVFW